MGWRPVKLLKDTVFAFIDDEALSRGAAIAFYAVTSIAPVLLIVIAIAGLAFGHDAAENAIRGQLSSLMGQQTADVVQTAVASAAGKSSGILATLIGVVTLLATASGVFGEMQSALNVIWKAEPRGTTLSRLIRARAASLGLVAALGFLLMVSLVVSAGLTAFGAPDHPDGPPGAPVELANGRPTSLLGPGTRTDQEPHQGHVPGGPEHALAAAGFVPGRRQ